MSDDSVRKNTLRVTTCDTDESLAAASGLFNQCRHRHAVPASLVMGSSGSCGTFTYFPGRVTKVWQPLW